MYYVSLGKKFGIIPVVSWIAHCNKRKMGKWHNDKFVTYKYYYVTNESEYELTERYLKKGYLILNDKKSFKNI